MSEAYADYEREQRYYDELMRQKDETAKRLTAQLIADWRERHPEATCSDQVAQALAEMEALVGRKPLW